MSNNSFSLNNSMQQSQQFYYEDFNPEQFQCKLHDSIASYFCIQEELNPKSRLACGECMLEGAHINHEYIKIKQLKSLLNKIQRNQKQLPDSVKNLKNKIKNFADNLKKQVADKVDSWEKDLQFQIDKKTNPSKHIVNMLSDEDLKGIISKQQFALVKMLLNPRTLKKIQPYTLDQQEEQNIEYKMIQIQQQINLLLEDSFKPMQQAQSQLDQELIEQIKQDEQKAILQNKIVCLKKYAEFQAHNNLVRVIEDMGNGIIATGGGDKKIRLFDMNRLKDPCVCVLQGHRATVNTILYVNENTMVSGGDDNQIIMWFLNGHKDYINQIIRIDDQFVCSASNDGTIKFWDLNSSIFKKEFIGHKGAVYDILKYNEDVLISCGADFTLKIWSIEQEFLCKTLSGHTADVNTLCDINQNLIASGSHDNTIRVWDIQQLECIHILEGHSSSIWKIIRVDQEIIVSASHDKSIRVWKVQDEEASLSKEYRDRNSYYTSLLYLDQTLIAGCTDGYIVQYAN